MTIECIAHNGCKVAAIRADEVIIRDAQSALDLMATVRYETGCDSMILPKSAVAEEFFILSTGLAGEVLQKYVNYYFKVAIVGDYSHYTSKPLRDFIYESNKGGHVFFAGTEKEALEQITRQ